MDTTTAIFELTYGCPPEYPTHLFHIECDETTCYISHHFGDGKYYLSYDEGFKFTIYKNENSKFYYHLDGNVIRLFKKVNGDMHYVKCVRGSGHQYSLILDLRGDYNRDIDIYINNEEENIQYYIDSSWVRYDRSNFIDSIDGNLSNFTLDSQFLMHHEYFTESDVNFIPLKNNLTYKGTSTNGHNLYKSYDGTIITAPLIDYRNYNAIHSGINQEYGSENITLSFIFTDQVYHIDEGDELIFNIPPADKNNLMPLYPYSSLNINDTTFAKSGAFGSDNPKFADKFKKFNNENTKLKDKDGNQILNNYTYLCTWLYQPEEDATPVWMDRYYYPDAVSRKAALENPYFKLSFENIPDLYYTRELTDAEKTERNIDDILAKELTKFKLNLQNNTYVDKKSDLFIEPGTSYKYSRISNEMVEDIFAQLEENRIEYVKDRNSNDVSLQEVIPLNGEQYRKVPGELFNNSKSINFNTDLYINPAKKIGIQLFGSDYNYGFNIQNRKDLCPYLYYASKKSLYLLNNKFQVRQEFNCYEKYNLEILYFIADKPFDDIYVITKESIFIFEYDLRLKGEIKLDDNNIKNIGVGVLHDLTPYDITGYTMLEYNKNLYAGINYKNKDGEIIGVDVLKIVLNPDCAADINEAEKLFGTDYKNKKFARILTQDEEYFTNFKCNRNESLIQTTPEIKSLYIDENTNKIYAFNYDVVKMSDDGDTIYGIYNNLSRGNNWYYIFNHSLSKLSSAPSVSKYAEFSSDISIDNIAFGPDGSFGLIRGFNPGRDNIINDRNKCLEIYDRSKTKVYNYPLSGYSEIISMDYCRYINAAFEEVDAFIILGIVNDTLGAVEYEINNQRINIWNITAPLERLSSFKSMINGDRLLDFVAENKLYFNLLLPNKENAITYEWDLKTAQEGWYNINIELDLEKAIYKIKINDKLVFSANSLTHSTIFKEHGNVFNNMFENTYYIGVLGKQYGTTLHEIISDDVYDPYACQNSKMNNTTIYNRRLKYHEYQANRLKFNKINNLSITLPCGIRNGIEEIIRYFKYSKVPSISNKIKINISGLTELKKQTELESLKASILEALADNDCLTTIKEIEFIK